MHIDRTENVSFGNLYIAKDLNKLQNSIAENISKKLLQNSSKGISYLHEIENRGFDVIVIKPEFDISDRVRLCIIKDMQSHKMYGKIYNYLGAKPMGEIGMFFSAEKFLQDVDLKTHSIFKDIKAAMSKIFHA